MHFLLTKKLKYFMTVMEKKCLTKASEELFITRSPLGKSINELEVMLGDKLFFRKHGLYQPTHFAQNIYDKTLPIYKEILLLEEDLLRANKKKKMSIVVDKEFPDNIADVIVSSITKSDFLCEIIRGEISQEYIDSSMLSPDTVFITNSRFVTTEDIDYVESNSSAFLLIINKALKNNNKNLENLPLLIRKNLSNKSHKNLMLYLNKMLGFTPKINYVEGDVFDCLLMAGNGMGMMLLPLKTCELINISREHTILLSKARIITNFYYRKKSKNELKEIIKHINSLY